MVLPGPDLTVEDDGLMRAGPCTGGDGRAGRERDVQFIISTHWPLAWMLAPTARALDDAQNRARSTRHLLLAQPCDCGAAAK